MQLTFLGATQTVTGSKYLLVVHGKKILIDCGLYQGYKNLRQRNWDKLPVDPHTIDAVLITHAHIDHSGYIPVLLRNGYQGQIYSTEGTRTLCHILLPDSGHIQEEDAKHANQHAYSKHHPALPLYTYDEGLRAMSRFTTLPFHQKHQLFEDVFVEFLPAGHIIGSALIRITAEGKSILFTGDIGRPNDPLMKPPVIVTAADYLVIESTYGDRLHGTSNPLDELEKLINQTITAGGSVIIPAFAVGRTQDLLYYLHLLKKDQRIPNIPAYLDSPMAINASDILSRFADEHKLSPELCKLICNEVKYVNTPEESKALDQNKTQKIIISASGMLEGGRILHHLKAYLPDEHSTIILTGFQAGGTRGASLERHETEIKIHGEMIPVRAKIAAMNNMSAHTDYQELLAWCKHFKHPPRKTFIIHGDIASSESLRDKISHELGWNCIIPNYLQQENL